MDDYRTTIAVQRYLDELLMVDGSAPAEPIVRALLARSVNRLHLLCKTLLHQSYPRLTKGPLNLEADELLGAVVERLIKAMREVRPGNVRQFFALANQHIRWELNDLARRLDKCMPAAELTDSFAAIPSGAPSQSGVSASTQRILQAIDNLPEEEREVFNLVRIQGMTRAEAACVIGCAEKTVQRRLGRCLAHLTEALGDMLPPAPPADDRGDPLKVWHSA